MSIFSAVASGSDDGCRGMRTRSHLIALGRWEERRHSRYSHILSSSRTRKQNRIPIYRHAGTIHHPKEQRGMATLCKLGGFSTQAMGSVKRSCSGHMVPAHKDAGTVHHQTSQGVSVDHSQTAEGRTNDNRGDFSISSKFDKLHALLEQDTNNCDAFKRELRALEYRLSDLELIVLVACMFEHERDYKLDRGALRLHIQDFGQTALPCSEIEDWLWSNVLRGRDYERLYENKNIKKLRRQGSTALLSMDYVILMLAEGDSKLKTEITKWNRGVHAMVAALSQCPAVVKPPAPIGQWVPQPNTKPRTHMRPMPAQRLPTQQERPTKRRKPDTCN